MTFDDPPPALPPKDRPVGLLAGAGTFPLAFAAAARRAGYRVHALGVRGHADRDLASACDGFGRVGLAKLGSAIGQFKAAGVSQVVMAGKIHKRVLFDPLVVFRLWPDWRTVHMWFTYARENRKDDTLLLAVIREFARDGLTFGSALDFAPELLVPAGPLTRRKPTKAEWGDIAFGWHLAREMGRLDVGQSVAVCDKAVLAVEAIEGTDENIRRAGALCRRGGFTVVKVAKPHQDRRFDVPTVGVETLQTLKDAGGRVLAIESERTIVLDREAFVATADRLGVAVVACSAAEIESRVAA